MANYDINPKNGSTISVECKDDKAAEKRAKEVGGTVIFKGK